MSQASINSMKQSVKASSNIFHLRLPPLPSPRDLLNLYQLRARKQLSQNFLFDGRVVDKVAKAAGIIEGGDVCEVGPGPGSITRSLLRRNPGRLIVVEKDARFLPFLEMLQEATNDRLSIVLGDVLSIDMSKMFREDLRVPWESKRPNIHLIGNLPFSVSTPLIIRWLKDISLKQNAWSYGRVRMTLTFQKEVAERIIAEADSRQRCRLSVMCQNWCDVKYSFTIPGSAFIPPPDVDVGVVTLIPRIEPHIKEDFHFVEKVVRQMSCYRQKRCIRSAETLFPPHIREKMGTELLILAEINPDTRSYQLTMDEFRRIILAFRRMCSENPKLIKYQAGMAEDESFWEEDIALQDENRPVVTN